MKTFKFAPGLDLRVIDIEGSPWFIAKDVCEALLMPLAKGTGHYLTKLYPHEKQTLAISEGKRGNPNTTAISESGLYKLILKSRKPEAEEFQRWVTEQVLPTIRKTGGYMTPEVAVMAVEDPAVFMARALVIGFSCGFVSRPQGPPQPLQASECKPGRVAAGTSRERG